MPKTKLPPKGGNPICSFVDTGVLPGDSRPAVWDWVWPGIAQKGLPLKKPALEVFSVCSNFIFGNKNQRGQ